MKGKKTKRKGMKSQKTTLVRASISFPPDLYETLEEIAKQKKVSLAWVVREASERYAVDETGKDGNGRTQAGLGTGKLTRRST
jgi:metal-responsive CopG/Arc/MetJ family transcriptional regulator